MNFTIVDVPTAIVYGTTAPIMEALLANIGKAIEIPFENRDANSYRKTIRASLSNKGLLAKYNFRTKVNTKRKSITVWLELKTSGTQASLLDDLGNNEL